MKTTRIGLLGEVVAMALDTVRTNKMRSALTILGVVIGITSIVGMTALVRGFDQSLREMIRAIGPNTIFIQRFGVTSFANGAEVTQLFKSPTLTVSDARADHRLGSASSIMIKRPSPS
jgi:putative ABC transport system permease protein